MFSSGHAAAPRYSRARHPGLTIALHWGTVLAIVIAVGAMLVRDAVEDTASRQALLEVHRQLGLVLLVGVGVRIAVRWWRGLADHAPRMAVAMRWAARITHVLLYGLLVALPLSGWALTNAHGVSLLFLGAIHLPQVLPADAEVADELSDYHVWLAWCMLAFVALHAIAALWHHFVRRDAVLRAMLPGAFGRLPGDAR
jgi:cytochrome b561